MRLKLFSYERRRVSNEMVGQGFNSPRLHRKRGWDKTVLAENEEGEENLMDFLLLLSLYSAEFCPSLFIVIMMPFYIQVLFVNLCPMIQPIKITHIDTRLNRLSQTHSA